MLVPLLLQLLPRKDHTRSIVALLLLAFYPFFLLTCYMADKGFYAFEIFTSVFGLVVPFVFMAVIGVVLPVFMLMFWGGILIVLEHLFRTSLGRGEGDSAERFGDVLKKAGGALAFNALMLGLFLWAMYTTDAEGAFRPLMAILLGSLVLGFVAVLLRVVPPQGRPAIGWTLFVLLLLGPMLRLADTTSLVEAVLTQFRLGGVMVTVMPADRATSLSEPRGLYGRLVLLSSAHVYLEVECPRKLLILPRSDTLRLEFAAIRTAGLSEFTCPDEP